MHLILGFTQIDVKVPSAIGATGTALFRAARIHYPSSVRLLLEHGANVDIDQPLRFLNWYMFGNHAGGKKMDVIRRCRETVDILVQYGATMDLSSEDGKAALDRLINPVNSNGIDTDIVRGARSILELLFVENAVKLNERCRTWFELYCFLFNTPGKPNLKFMWRLGYRCGFLVDPDRASFWRKFQRPTPRFRTLQHMAKVKVRKVLGSPLSTKVKDLPLPSVMKNYLLLR